MSVIFLILFIITIFLCFYTYLLYPVLIQLFSKLFPFRVKKLKYTPFISILIPAFNEAKNIRQKLLNTLALEYPKDRMEILVGSDGSSDDTVSIAQQFSQNSVSIYDFKVNRGKTAVQNDLVRKSNGEILVFTDAASFIPKDTIQRLLNNFSDDRVGCVAGRMRFVDTDTNLTTQSQGLYWRYETKLRELESKIGSLIGVDGPLYAVRRDCYIEIEHSGISDLLTPLLVLHKGKKVVFESEALVDEDPTRSTKDEFATRRRITLRGLIGFARNRKLLNPVKNPLLAFQIFSHKIVRWFIGPLVILNMVTCLTLSAHIFYNVVLIIYGLFFLLALVGWIAAIRGIKWKILIIPYYFCLVNFAATLGIIDFIRKRQATTWEPVRN